MAKATDRNDKLANPGSDAPKIVAFFEELQKVMTGEKDIYQDTAGADIARKWKYGAGIGFVSVLREQIAQLQNEVNALKASSIAMKKP